MILIAPRLRTRVVRDAAAESDSRTTRLYLAPPRPAPSSCTSGEREKERKRERGVGGRGGVGSGRRKNTDFSSLIGHDHSYRGSTAWTSQGIHERAFILALQSWLAKVASYQPGLAFVERNKPGYTEEDLASLDLA